MEKKNTIKNYIILFVTCIFVNHALAQFVPMGPGGVGGDRYGVTTSPPPVIANIKAIGIGQFTNANPPQAIFHINSFLLSTTLGNPLTFNPGKLFQTECPSGFDSKWQMYTGPTQASSSAKLEIYVPANSNRAVFQTTQSPGSDIRFNTGGAITRMIVTDGPNGFIGIHTINPNFTLEVNGTTASKKFIALVDEHEIDLLQEIEALKKKS